MVQSPRTQKLEKPEEFPDQFSFFQMQSKNVYTNPAVQHSSKCIVLLFTYSTSIKLKILDRIIGFIKDIFAVSMSNI